MLEIPNLEEIVAERTRETVQQNIAAVLEVRFGDVPNDLIEAIGSVVDEKQLKDLVRLAAACPDLAAFRRDDAGPTVRHALREVAGCGQAVCRRV